MNLPTGFCRWKTAGSLELRGANMRNKVLFTLSGAGILAACFAAYLFGNYPLTTSTGMAELGTTCEVGTGPKQWGAGERRLQRFVYLTYLDDSGSSAKNLKDKSRFQVVTAVLNKDS